MSQVCPAILCNAIWGLSRVRWWGFLNNNTNPVTRVIRERHHVGKIPRVFLKNAVYVTFHLFLAASLRNEVFLPGCSCSIHSERGCYWGMVQVVKWPIWAKRLSDLVWWDPVSLFLHTCHVRAEGRGMARELWPSMAGPKTEAAQTQGPGAPEKGAMHIYIPHLIIKGPCHGTKEEEGRGMSATLCLDPQKSKF